MSFEKHIDPEPAGVPIQHNADHYFTGIVDMTKATPVGFPRQAKSRYMAQGNGGETIADGSNTVSVDFSLQDDKTADFEWFAGDEFTDPGVHYVGTSDLRVRIEGWIQWAADPATPAPYGSVKVTVTQDPAIQGQISQQETSWLGSEVKTLKGSSWFFCPVTTLVSGDYIRIALANSMGVSIVTQNTLGSIRIAIEED